jgi:hypothetical protein
MLFAAVLAAGAGPLAAQTSAGPGAPVLGWIELKPAARGAGIVTITGHAYALSPAEGRFTLAVARAGKGGKTNSSQSGAFKLDAGEDKPLSTTSINVAPGEALTIELKLFSGGSEVFSATLKTAPQSGSTKI